MAVTVTAPLPFLKSLTSWARAACAPLSASDLSHPSAVPTSWLQPAAFAGATATQSPAKTKAYTGTYKNSLMLGTPFAPKREPIRYSVCGTLALPRFGPAIGLLKPVALMPHAQRVMHVKKKTVGSCRSSCLLAPPPISIWQRAALEDRTVMWCWRGSAFDAPSTKQSGEATTRGG